MIGLKSPVAAVHGKRILKIPDKPGIAATPGVTSTIQCGDSKPWH
jgi:hypothetical protein